MKQVVRTAADGNEYSNIQVVRLDTRGKILDITDTVDYKFREGVMDSKEKVSFNATSYGENVQSVNTHHKMDLDDFFVLARDVIAGKPVEYTEYKGNKNPSYSTGYESRVFSFKWDPEMGHGKGAYAVTLTTGAGQSSDKGAVSPAKGAKDPVKTVNLIVSKEEARRVMLTANIYFEAKLTAFLSTHWDKLYQ